jgi:hypothetical protein
MSFIKRRKKKSTKTQSKSTIDSFLNEVPKESTINNSEIKEPKLQKTKMFIEQRKQKLKEEYKKTIKKVTNKDESQKPEKILGGDFKKY